MTQAVIDILREEDAPALAQLLASQRPAYLQMFFPFPFDERSLRARLREARRDRYWALRQAGELAGFFMLRGFDEGFSRPSFGVFVAEARSGQGFARQALAHALDWAREAGVEEMMLKVDPRNASAVELYRRTGFAKAGTDAVTGHDVMVRREPSR